MITGRSVEALTADVLLLFFFFSSRRRHTRLQGDWSSDVCSSDLDRASTAETFSSIMWRAISLWVWRESITMMAGALRGGTILHNLRSSDSSTSPRSERASCRERV